MEASFSQSTKHYDGIGANCKKTVVGNRCLFYQRVLNTIIEMMSYLVNCCKELICLYHRVLNTMMELTLFVVICSRVLLSLYHIVLLNTMLKLMSSV